MSSAASDPDRSATGQPGSGEIGADQVDPDRSGPDPTRSGPGDFRTDLGGTPGWPAGPADWTAAPVGPDGAPLPGGATAYMSLPPGQPERPRQAGRTLAVGAAVVLVLTLLGAPLGLLWAIAAPGVPLVKTADGAVLAQQQPEGFIAADGWFSLLGVGFGVLAAIGVWLVLRRYRGPAGLCVAVLGSIGAALVAWRTGRLVGLAEYQRLLESAQVGRTFDRPADLRAGGFEWFLGMVPYVRGDLLLAAFAAAVTYTLLAGWSRWPSLRPETEQDQAAGWVPVGPPVPFSSDSAARPAPSAAPERPGPGVTEPPRG